MKLLLKAALRVKRHFTLFFITMATLIGLTIANQTEMFTLGVLSDAGADFFSLFASKNDKGEQNDHVTFKEVQEKWSKIDREKQGVITKDDAQSFMIKKTDTNPLKRVMYQIKRKFHLEHNLKAFILLLCFIALNKAVFLFFSRYTTQKLSIRICRDLRQQYFDHLQHQPMSFFQKYNIGTLSPEDRGGVTRSVCRVEPPIARLGDKWKERYCRAGRSGVGGGSDVDGGCAVGTWGGQQASVERRAGRPRCIDRQNQVHRTQRCREDEELRAHGDAHLRL